MKHNLKYDMKYVIVRNGGGILNLPGSPFSSLEETEIAMNKHIELEVQGFKNLNKSMTNEDILALYDFYINEYTVEPMSYDFCLTYK